MRDNAPSLHAKPSCEFAANAPNNTTHRYDALQFLHPGFDGAVLGDGAPPTRFNSGTAAPEDAAAVSKHAVGSDSPRVRAYTARAVQNVWQAKQPMK